MDAFWTGLPEDALRLEASAHLGACDDGDLHPDDLDWRLAAVPVDVLIPLMTGGRESWREWLADEIADAQADGGDRASDWPSVDEPDDVHEPVVVTIDGARVQIWDGWHRTACAIVRGDATVPAILGTPPDEPAGREWGAP